MTLYSKIFGSETYELGIDALEHILSMIKSKTRRQNSGAPSYLKQLSTLLSFTLDASAHLNTKYCYSFIQWWWNEQKLCNKEVIELISANIGNRWMWKCKRLQMHFYVAIYTMKSSISLQCQFWHLHIVRQNKHFVTIDCKMYWV